MHEKPKSIPAGVYYPTPRGGHSLFVYETALWVANSIFECQERSGTLLVEFFA